MPYVSMWFIKLHTKNKNYILTHYQKYLCQIKLNLYVFW